MNNLITIRDKMNPLLSIAKPARDEMEARFMRLAISYNSFVKTFGRANEQSLDYLKKTERLADEMLEEARRAFRDLRPEETHRMADNLANIYHIAGCITGMLAGMQSPHPESLEKEQRA